MGNYCTRWHPCFKGLSLDGGQAYFSKKPPRRSFNKDLSNEPTFGRTISLDSTFKWKCFYLYRIDIKNIWNNNLFFIAFWKEKRTSLKKNVMTLRSFSKNFVLDYNYAKNVKVSAVLMKVGKNLKSSLQFIFCGRIILGSVVLCGWNFGHISTRNFSFLEVVFSSEQLPNFFSYK